MTRIFISYRRQDSQHQADRLYKAAKPFVHNPDTDLFIDVDDIPYGVDFEVYLKEQVQQSDVVLVLIGPNWLTITDPETNLRRLDNEFDFVRIEVVAGLDRINALCLYCLMARPCPELLTYRTV